MSATGRSHQPLSGVRVIDFTQVMMGPCATQTLGDYGADVIKIERIGAGDLSRWSIGDDPGWAAEPSLLQPQPNKRSIALDLKSRAGVEIVHRLLAERRCRGQQFPRRRDGAHGPWL